MVWFFEKDADELRLELHFDRETRVYSIVRRDSNGSVNRIDVLGEALCRQLLLSIEQELAGIGWRKLASPVILAVQ